MIYTVVGARPNFLKIDPELEQKIIYTGQHYSKSMTRDLPAPDISLNCKSDELGKMLDKLTELFTKDRPDMVIVFGDTASSLAGGLAAKKAGCKLAHIEAGLRSYTDMPEEMNRVILDRIADVRFCPTEYAELNLMKEGLREHNYVVGDPEFDAMARHIPIKKSKNYRKYNLLTLHRNFNTDDRGKLENIFHALDGNDLFIFPTHPRTKKMVKMFSIAIPENIKVIAPVSFEKSLSLISNANKVVTDSGGVQREAYWMNVPVIILRKETEWVDIVQKGAGILVGTDVEKIKDALANFKGKMNAPPELANKKIREVLYKYL